MIDPEQAKNKIKELEDEIAQIKIEANKLRKEYKEIQKKIVLSDRQINQKNREIKELDRIIETENVFNSVHDIDGFDILDTNELIAISNGMDRTDYTKYGSTIPRWIDLEKLVKEVIKFKKHYEGFVLDKIVKNGQVDTLPPENIYRFTYKTPYGHYLSCGGVELIN